MNKENLLIVLIMLMGILISLNNFYALYKLAENQRECVVIQNITKVIDYPKILKNFHINKTYQDNYNCVNFTMDIYKEFIKENITAIPLTGFNNKIAHRAIAIVFEPQTGKPYMMGEFDIWRISGESRYWNFSISKR